MGESWYAAATAVGKAMLTGLDVTVRSGGQEHVPESGPVVLAANHVSFPDFVFIGQAMRSTHRYVRFMARRETWRFGLVARAMDGMGHIPVDRAAPASAYLIARRLLGEGEVVCAFPEGGISAAYTVRAMMPGAVALARETGAPLVPVSIWGSQRLWPQKRSRDAPFPRPTLSRGRLVDVRFHEPVSIAAGADLTEGVRDLGQRLWQGLEELQRLPDHRPRPGEWAPWYPAHLGGNAVERQASFALDGMPRSAVPPTWGPLG